MTTNKCYISEEFSQEDLQFIEDKCRNYSYGFRRMYKMFEESSDHSFISKFKEIFGMNDIEFRSLLSDVGSFKKREETCRKNKLKRIDELNVAVSTDKELTKKERYKAIKTLVYLTKRINKGSTFGGLSLQRQLTRECNKKDDKRNEKKIQDLKDLWRNKRTLPFQIMGEGNQTGNRFFDLTHISTGVIIYKPYKGKKIEIHFKVHRNKMNDYKKIEELVSSDSLPVTVSLSKDYIYFTYDEERLRGYSVDESSRRKDVQKIKSEHHPKESEKELIKDVYKRYYDDQKNRKLNNKVKDRCLAIDMNPEYIGFCVLDKSNEDIDIIHKGVVDLTELCKSTGKSSTSDETKYKNNKRKYEVTVIVKELFKLIEHYKCSSFVIEDLNPKQNSVKQLPTGFNRKTKNVWNREILTNCINRRCNEIGVELIEVNPCYTSFIGNIKYRYYDPCNASIEIGRRGLYKYEKGGFYPPVSEEDICTLDAKFGDVVKCSTNDDWIDIYKSLKNSFKKEEFSYRLRTRLEQVQIPYQVFSMNSYKSDVKIILFN